MRATGDSDIWVVGSERNAAKVTAAVSELGFDVPGLTDEKFTSGNRGKVVQKGRLPLRIDVITIVDGVSFEDCYERKVTEEWDGLRVPLISRDDLLRNKTASGRPKDLADVDALERVPAGPGPPADGG